jgi:SAM-dependent methyltransferase
MHHSTRGVVVLVSAVTETGDDMPLDGRPPERFEAVYQAGTPPWDIGRPQPAFAALAEAGAVRGRVLDLGCGTGEHILMAAAQGLEAVGVDLSPTAIASAERKAAARDLVATFVVADVLDLAALRREVQGEFDTVLDCGLFHTFSDADRARYLTTLKALTNTGGQLHLMCFSDREPGTWGPRRISDAEIRESFLAGWRIDSLQPAFFETTLDSGQAAAWLATITRT